MEPFQIIAFLTAGISLAMGLVSLFSGLHRDGEKTELVFGIMCMVLFIYFIIPPLGFIIIDQAPYPPNIIIKRAFNFFYAGLFPWFVLLYTGYKKKLLPFSISSLYLLSYIIMAFTVNDTNRPLWVMGILLSVALSVVHGFLAVHYQLKSGAISKGRWFLFAMCIYAAFFVLSAINQLGNNYFGRLLNAKLFYPINLFPLAFILIMGIRLRTNSIDRFRLERILRARDIRWQSLMENMHVIIVQLDIGGIIKYINPYGITLLGYSEASDVLNKNWFDQFLPTHEARKMKSIFQQVILKKESFSDYKNPIVSKDNKQKIIYWSNVLIYSDDGFLTGTLSIGTDITDQENAFEQIQNLKAELEKENLMLRGEPVPDWMRQEIIGKSQAVTYAVQKAKQAAPTHASVLLEGETGVGKELFADLIHRTSLRNALPFIKVNCGALPAELIEDELFGHEKGAFTGAIQARKGRFEMADGGTIFLDEIGELPLSLQPKLLRVLQNGEFEKIGGQKTSKVDVRIIAATNRNLENEVAQGRFRNDLYYRLDVFPITIPALRNRKEDIPALVHFFIEKEGKKHNKKFENISRADMNHLSEYEWPGNIRELRNVIERSVISSDNNTLRLDWFYNGIETRNNQNSTSSLEQIEKDHILKVLEECRWRINGDNGAAEKLAMHPNTLRSRMKKLSIIRPGNGLG